jgi:transposase
MRGDDKNQSSMFHYFSIEKVVPDDHPIRRIRKFCDEALGRLSNVFDMMYSDLGRPSIAPEKLLKSQILIALYSVRSDELFCQMLGYNLLFRWFLGMDMDEAVFDRSTFSKNRERLIENEVGQEFLRAVVEMAREGNLVSSEHFTVDGTLIEAWASMKSFQPKGKPSKRDKNDRNGDVDFKGEKRSNATHESTTDPDSQLYRKGLGKEAKLSFMGHSMIENRNGLILATLVTKATGTAEREAALQMLDQQEIEGGTLECHLPISLLRW